MRAGRGVSTIVTGAAASAMLLTAAGGPAAGAVLAPGTNTFTKVASCNEPVLRQPASLGRPRWCA